MCITREDVQKGMIPVWVLVLILFIIMIFSQPNCAPTIKEDNRTALEKRIDYNVEDLNKRDIVKKDSTDAKK